MIDQLKQQVADSLPRFEKTAGTVPWAPRSILKSEGLAVCAMADLYGIDLLIESGICNGRSTEMWCRYGVQTFAIDWEIRPATADRIRRYGATVMCSDAKTALPGLINDVMCQSDERIGVFIDGPKEQAAVDLAKKCMGYDAVQFVGVHDMAARATTRHGLDMMWHNQEGERTRVWATDADWFIELAHHLDADESNLDEEQGTRWTPYCRNEIGKPPVPLGSYGYTIAFLAKELP